MRVFQEEIFGSVLAAAKFSTDEETMAIANDTLYGLGTGIWTRNVHKAYRFGRGIQAEVEFGQIVIIFIQLMLLSVVINNQALDVRII